jgi:hypothetical protein
LIVGSPRSGWVYLTAQLELVPFPSLTSVQLAASKLPLVSFDTKLTVPVGTPAVPSELSLTFAVQLIDTLTARNEGAQLTETAVVRCVKVSVAWPLLAAKAPPPANEAVSSGVPVSLWL